MERVATSQSQLARFHERVFNAQEDRIPLIVSPPCPDGPTGAELATDTEPAVVRAAYALRPKVDAGTDWIPTVVISWYQCIVVPSLFGAQPIVPEGSEPIVKPVFRSVSEAAAAGVPSVEGPLINTMFSTLDKALKSIPDSFSVAFPPTASPFDLAQLLLPAEEFLAALITEPEASKKFLDNLSRLCIQVFQLVRTRINDAGMEHVTNRGLRFPGLRLPCDAIVNFSPDLIRQVVLPVLEEFQKHFGRLCIHYCTEPAPSGHVLPVLCESESVGAVDNWQGPNAFIGNNAPARMQSKIAVIIDTDLSTEEKINKFLDWEPIRTVPRKNGRGVVVHTSAESVDDAKRIYGIWRDKTG